MRISQLIHRLKELKKEIGFDMPVVLITEHDEHFHFDFGPTIDVFEMPDDKVEGAYRQVVGLLPHDCGPDEKPPHLRLV